MSQITWLGPQDPFPNPLYCNDPDDSVPGLLAVSERIYPGQLIKAYQLGIFPWYSDNQPVLWWSPDPRGVLPLDGLQVSRSLRKSVARFDASIDDCFEQVVRHCGDPGREHGWINDDIVEAYVRHGAKLPWYIDLLNAVLGVTDRAEAARRGAHAAQTLSRLTWAETAQQMAAIVKERA